MATKTTTYVPYKVKDITLADWGRKEIELAAVSYTHLTLPTIYSV